MKNKKGADDSIYINGWEIFWCYTTDAWIARDPKDRKYASENSHWFALLHQATQFALTNKLTKDAQ